MRSRFHHTGFNQLAPAWCGWVVAALGAFDLSRAMAGAPVYPDRFVCVAVSINLTLAGPGGVWRSQPNHLLLLAPEVQLMVDDACKSSPRCSGWAYPLEPSQAFCCKMATRPSITAMNGFGWPLVMNVHIGSGTYSLVLFLLIWMLAARMRRPVSGIVLCILLALWALVWESSYGAYLIAGIGVTAYLLWKKKGDLRGPVGWLAAALLISIPEIFGRVGRLRNWPGRLDRIGGTAAVTEEGARQVADSRAGPAFFSKHFGSLAIFSPRLLVALLEKQASLSSPLDYLVVLEPSRQRLVVRHRGA
jgi:hypothetical protein